MDIGKSEERALIRTPHVEGHGQHYSGGHSRMLRNVSGLPPVAARAVDVEHEAVKNAAG